MSDLELKEKDLAEEDEESKEDVGEDSKKNGENDRKKKKNGEKKKLKERIKDFFANPKKRLIFIISLGIILIAAVSTGMYFLTHEKTGTEKLEEKKNEVAEEPKYQAILDGVMTDQTSANRHPLAIMVENHPDARPQAGLDKASVVYEAIAEGGITRFLAVYGTNEAEKVGPVRSARTYYVDWAHGFDAYYAHVGGNMDALEKIPKDKIMDLDQFRYSAPYWREKSAGVSSEHTMFTSTLKLRDQATKNNYSTSNNFNVYKYKEDPKDAERDALPESQKVTVNFSSADYKVDFIYDKIANSYKRLLAGKSHTDRITKDQLTAKNIVVMTMTRKATVTKINETGYIMDTVGSGKAKFFLDGKETDGTWKKQSSSDREMFYDASGNEVTFNRGQLWICVIPPESTVVVTQ